MGALPVTLIDVPVPCTFDFNVAMTKYVYGLDDGELPTSLLFSGTVFTPESGASGCADSVGSRGELSRSSSRLEGDDGPLLSECRRGSNCDATSSNGCTSSGRARNSDMEQTVERMLEVAEVKS